MRDAATMSFHLLRPLWLLALIPLAVVFAVLLRRQDVRAQWGGVIAPHLLTHLIVRPGQGRQINPLYLVAAGMMLGIIGLSGPTWRRELPPFVEDKAPLMIALAVGSSMNETDVAPSRLERAKQKIRDLLAARAGARTGLVAFAGTAHLVMPPTDDRSVIEPFLAALGPGLMPADGKNVAGAVALAGDALAAEPVPGTVLLVADDLGTADAATVRQAAGRNGLVIFAVSPDTSALPAGADVIRVSIDGSDITRLERRIETRFQAAQGDTFGTQWRDEGYWLLPPLALLSLLWFRRGTTVAWVLALFIVTHACASRAEETSRFTNLWLTPDQQGRLAFDRGDYAAAKTMFADPMWRGISAYRAYDFHAAAEEFSRVDTLEGKFALGNAQAQNHAYEKALKTYDDVLKAQPGNAAAKTNRAIVQAALDAREAKRRKQEQDDPAPPDEKADEMRVDPNQKGGKKITVTPQDVTTAGAAEAWMRQVQTSPADFLKLKFAGGRSDPGEGVAVRVWIGFIAVLLGAPPPPAVYAQQSVAFEPIVQVTIDPPRVVVGQKTTLSVLVMAPNYMTSPPELPDFQVRNAVTRQLQSVNTSEQWDGVAYAGVRFEYAISPQEPGSYAVADQSVRIKYAAEPPATREVAVALPRVSFEAFIPVAASALRPFVSANNLIVEQDIKRSSDPLKAGGAVTRTITIRAEGTPAMLLPPQQFPPVDGLKLYPAQPTLEDKIDGRSDVMTSTRVDSATYMVERAGDYSLPSVDIGWWNVGSGKVEQVHLEAVPLKAVATSVAAGPASSNQSAQRWTWDSIVDFIFDHWLMALLLMAVTAGFAWFAPRVARRVAASLHRRHQAYLQSEAFAFSRLRRAIRHRDSKASYFALLEWLPHLNVTQPPIRAGAFKAVARDPELDCQLDAIESELFGNRHNPAHWSPRRLLHRVVAARRRLRPRAGSRATTGLPPHLNPVGTPKVAAYGKPAR